MEVTDPYYNDRSELQKRISHDCLVHIEPFKLPRTITSNHYYYPYKQNAVRLSAGCDRILSQTRLDTPDYSDSYNNVYATVESRRKPKIYKCCRKLFEEKNEYPICRQSSHQSYRKNFEHNPIDTRSYVVRRESEISILPETSNYCEANDYRRKYWPVKTPSGTIQNQNKRFSPYRENMWSQDIVREPDIREESSIYNGGQYSEQSLYRPKNETWRRQPYLFDKKKVLPDEEEYIRNDIITGQPILIKRRSIDSAQSFDCNRSNKKYEISSNEIGFRGKEYYRPLQNREEEYDSDYGRESTEQYYQQRERSSEFLPEYREPIKEQLLSTLGRDRLSNSNTVLSRRMSAGIGQTGQTARFQKPTLSAGIKKNNAKDIEKSNSACCCCIGINIGKFRRSGLINMRNGIQDMNNDWDKKSNYSSRSQSSVNNDYDQMIYPSNINTSCYRQEAGNDSNEYCACADPYVTRNVRLNGLQNICPIESEYDKERRRLFSVEESTSEEMLQSTQPRCIIQSPRGEGGKFLKRLDSSQFVADKRSLAKNYVIKNLLDIIPEKENKSNRNCSCDIDPENNYEYIRRPKFLSMFYDQTPESTYTSAYNAKSLRPFSNYRSNWRSRSGGLTDNSFGSRIKKTPPCHAKINDANQRPLTMYQSTYGSGKNNEMKALKFVRMSSNNSLVGKTTKRIDSTKRFRAGGSRLRATNDLSIPCAKKVNLEKRICCNNRKKSSFNANLPVRCC